MKWLVKNKTKTFIGNISNYYNIENKKRRNINSHKNPCSLGLYALVVNK